MGRIFCTKKRQHCIPLLVAIQGASNRPKNKKKKKKKVHEPVELSKHDSDVDTKSKNSGKSALPLPFKLRAMIFSTTRGALIWLLVNADVERNVLDEIEGFPTKKYLFGVPLFRYRSIIPKPMMCSSKADMACIHMCLVQGTLLSSGHMIARQVICCNTQLFYTKGSWHLGANLHFGVNTLQMTANQIPLGS